MFGLPNIEGQLLIWALAMIRPGAALLAAPVFGAPSVPVQIRLVIALGLGIPAITLSGVTLPADGMMSFQGLMMVISEALAGLAMGFAVQIGFSAAVLAGEVISNAMGLGFAAMNDPMGGSMSPAVGQFLSLVATFLFMSMGGHLVLAGIVVQSYQALPPGSSWLSHEAIGGLIRFGGLVFSAGLSIALPVAFATLLVQIIMGVISRSAPTLNLFAVGMPATLMAGIVLMIIALPTMADAISASIDAGLAQARTLAAG